MASSRIVCVCLLFAGVAVSSVVPDPAQVKHALRGSSGPSTSADTPHGPNGEAPGEASDSRQLLLEVHFCESTLDILNPENIHPIWTEPSWMQDGAAIFLSVYVGITTALIALASVMDCRKSPVLERIQEARKEANHVHHGEGGALKRSLTERYGTRTDIVTEILEQITDKQEAEKIARRTAQLRLLLKPDAEEARKKAMAQVLAHFCARFSLRFYMAGLEPAAFQHIRSEELHTEGQAVVQEFLLLPQWQQARIAFLTSIRLVTGFFPNYSLPRSARVAATLIHGLAAAATACTISSYMGWKVGRSEKCHPTDDLTRYVRECFLAFLCLLIQEMPYYVILRIRRDGFLHAGWNKFALACCSWFRRRFFWLCMHLWFLWSVFMIVQFLATSSTQDGDHWIFVAAIILITANVLKPLIAACCVMAVYILANNLGMALVSDELHNCLRPKHADELTNEDLEQLDRKFLGQLLTCEGDAVAEETGKKKKKKKKKRRGELENNATEEEDEGNQPPASNATKQESGESEAETTMLDEMIMADIKAAEEQAENQPRHERPLKAGNTRTSSNDRAARTSIRTSRRMSVGRADEQVAERGPAADSKESAEAQNRDDLEEFESWTPLQSEKSFDGEPIKVARVAPPSGTVQWWDSGAPAQEAEVSSPAS